MSESRLAVQIAESWAGRSGEGYVRCHAPRYATLLSVLDLLSPTKDVDRILDVGRSPFTDIAHEHLAVPIDTLGFGPDRDTPTGRHYHFDLNDSVRADDWRQDIPAYPVVVLAEVIEHLHTAPSQVLPFLRSLLRPKGVLILQTPNAVAAHKRLKMLAGRHPYEPLREDQRNPGHIRELTMEEVLTYVRSAGFRVLRASAENYFDYRYARHAGDAVDKHPAYGVLNWIYRVLPASLKPGLTVVAETLDE